MNLALELCSVGKRYKHFELNDVSFNLPVGEVMGVIGPNGAGKSTLMRIIMGLIRQDRGTVKVLGFNMPEQCVTAKRNIGFVSEDMRLYEKEDLAWHMGFMASVYPDWDDKYAKKMLGTFELKDDQKLKSFSHGQRVKASLLLALAHRPKLLVLDEPTTGLDPVARAEVFSELMDILREEDRTILFSSHNTYDVEKISDRITFVDHGYLVATQEKETFLENWKRIRLQFRNDEMLPNWPEIVEMKRNGRLGQLVVNPFRLDLKEKLAQFGEILTVERMTLEEIFISAVRSSRKKEQGASA